MNPLDPDLLKNLDKLPPAQQKELLGLLSLYEEAMQRETAQGDFLSFVRTMWPPFISGSHFEIMADAFQRIADGKLKRLIINMPPRHGKSEFTSWLLPAWYLGRHPDRKVIQATHTADLSKDFGRKVRDLINSEEFHGIFPGVQLKADSKAAGRWNTNRGGEYFAVGVGGAMAGKGAHLMIIDDPHNEQEAQTQDPSAFDHVYDWYNTGPRQRLQPGAAICIVMTRWGQRDLTGRILKAEASRIAGGAPKEWEVIEFPMELPSGKVLWPQFWSMEEMRALRDELPLNRWMAQYQQQPVSEGAAIVKREWWKRWPSDRPPACEFIIQTWDTAFFAKQKNDFSACTTWGVFYNVEADGAKRANLILLDAFRERLEFPALKAKALAMYQQWQPDAFMVEMKASGAPLVFELRAMGIPVGEHHVNRGKIGQKNDKVARVSAVADMFQSGFVWAPDRRFSDEVIEEFAAFPVGEHDDMVDASIIALERFRRGGFVQLDSDDYDDTPMPRKRVSYY